MICIFICIVMEASITACLTNWLRPTAFLAKTHLVELSKASPLESALSHPGEWLPAADDIVQVTVGAVMQSTRCGTVVTYGRGELWHGTNRAYWHDQCEKREKCARASCRPSPISIIIPLIPYQHISITHTSIYPSLISAYM